MDALQRLVRSLKSARSYDLPEDNKAAYYVLLTYIMQNQHRPFIEILENNTTFDINFTHGKSKRTLLHMAANVGTLECLTYLLKKGAVADVPDRQGITPIQVAARNGFIKCIQKLLEYNASLEIKNNEGMTAIHWLASNGRTEVLVEIYKLIRDIDIEDDRGQTPLHVACRNGHYPTVVSLLSLNANIEKADVHGCTPLHTASEHGHAAVVKDLLQKGATLRSNCEKESPLLIALKGGYGKVCVELMESFPNLLYESIDAGEFHCVDFEKLCAAFTIVASHSICWRNNMLYKFSQHVSTEGLKLLSPSSNYQVISEKFMNALKIFNFLSSFIPESVNTTTSPSIRSRLNSSAVAHSAQKVDEYKELPTNLIDIENETTRIWSILHSWMRIIHLEELENNDKNKENKTENITEENNTHVQTTQRQTSQHSLRLNQLRLNQPAMEYNLQLSEIEYSDDFLMFESNDTSNNTENTDTINTDIINRPFSPFVRSNSYNLAIGENILRDTSSEHSLSLDNNEEDGNIAGNGISKESTASERRQSDVVKLTADRLCAVIHGYYLYCLTVPAWEQRSSSKRKSEFNSFIEKHRDVLLLLVSRNSQLIFDHFGFVLENPVFLQCFLPAIHSHPFKDRQEWFYKHLYKNKSSATFEEQSIINVTREALLDSSCKELTSRNSNALKTEITVRFDGEEGLGAGVTREWLDLLVKDMLNPDCALFTLSADGSTFQPNSNSSINPDHLSYFEFAGRVMGLTLYHKHLITAYFTRSFYKHILGVPVNYVDVESIDPEYSKNLQWILDNDITDLGLDITFLCETDVFGQMQEVELKSNGKNILVTEENKFEYVHLAADLRMTKAIKPQILSFLGGFYQFIPHSLVSLFNEYELELLLSGLPSIDLDDWIKNTSLQAGFEHDSQTIQWFWEVVKEFSKEEQVLLLQFVTGTSRVPWGGFSNLSGAAGVQQFTICRTNGKSLPTASTCFNMLKLPEYDSKEELRHSLKLSITCGSVGFAFA